MHLHRSDTELVSHCYSFGQKQHKQSQFCDTVLNAIYAATRQLSVVWILLSPFSFHPRKPSTETECASMCRSLIILCCFPFHCVIAAAVAEAALCARVFQCLYICTHLWFIFKHKCINWITFTWSTARHLFLRKLIAHRRVFHSLSFYSMDFRN